MLKWSYFSGSDLWNIVVRSDVTADTLDQYNWTTDPPPSHTVKSIKCALFPAKVFIPETW